MRNGSEQGILLSFAIPTYNFGKFIGETIDSIIQGAGFLTEDQYEIIILDGGSKDHTPQLLHQISQKYRNVFYQLNPERGGIDKDLNEVASLSRGKYIWLFSSDDLLKPNWDLCIKPLLEKEKDIYLVPAELCDLSMRHLRNNPIFKANDKNPIVFEMNSDPDLVYEYINKANTLEALFSFMSSIVVKKSVWHNLQDRPDYYGSCWAHCAKLIPIIFGNQSIVYVNEYLIKKRGGNDSFMENGFVSRIGIAVNGWGRIAFEFFKNESQRTLVLDALRKDMPILLFAYSKITAKDRADVKRLNKMCRSLYWEWTNTWNIKLNYILFLMIPGATKLNVILIPCLPFLIRLRHKIKALFL